MREVQDFLVRIFGSDGDLPSGCGFLIDKEKQHVLTCCHVVNAALGRQFDDPQPSDPVFLDFPFLASNHLIKAEIERWHYAADDPLNDICVLRLLDDAPFKAQPARMVRADDYSGDKFRAFGFPRGFEDDGREVKGVLGATQVSGRVLAEGISKFGYFIEPGFSGAPIWNTTQNGVCGMVFQVDTPPQVKVASVIPTELLIKAAPGIAELTTMTVLDPAIKHYLHSLIADLEKRMGVLQYVDLSGTTEEPSHDTNTLPFFIEEFGFSEIIQKRDQPSIHETIPLGNIRDAINKHSRFILVGDAGSSKTTTLRRLALDAAQEKQNRSDAPLPLLLYLPRWKEETSVEDFIQVQWREMQLPENTDSVTLLRSGDATLYLDGLNEMGSESADKAKKLREWLRSPNGPSHVIVTCRKDNYLGDYELGLPVVQIEPLNDDQIQQFVQKYLGDRTNAFLKRVIPHDELERQDARHLYHLAHNPYLLSALIVVFDTSPDQELPQSSGKLIRMLVLALAKREARRNTSAWIPFDERWPTIEKSIARLAYVMVEQGIGSEIFSEYALKYIDLLTFQAGLSANFLQFSTANTIQFHHQLLQDLFCAIHINAMGFEHFLSLNKGRLDGRWMEPLKALCNLTEIAEKDVVALAKSNLSLALACIHHGVAFSNVGYKEIEKRVHRTLRQGNVTERMNALDFVSIMNDKNATPAIIELITTPLGDAGVTNSLAALTLHRILGDEALEILIQLMIDSDRFTNVSVLNTIVSFREQAVPALKRVLDSSKTVARAYAYDALRAIYMMSQSKEAKRVIKSWEMRVLSSEKDVYILQYVITQVNYPEALNSLKKLLLNDSISNYTNFNHRRTNELAADALERIGTPKAIEAARSWRKKRRA